MFQHLRAVSDAGLSRCSRHVRSCDAIAIALTSRLDTGDQHTEFVVARECRPHTEKTLETQSSPYEKIGFASKQSLGPAVATQCYKIHY